MKNRVVKSLQIAFAFALSLGAASVSFAQCCLNFTPFPGVGVAASAGCTDNNTPFTVTLTSTAGMPIPAGNYTFWCIDDNQVDIFVPYTYVNATLYSSCDPNLLTYAGLRQPNLGSFANMPKVNYILNNPDHIAATYVDIQNAIWHYVGGPPGPNFLTCYNYSTGFPTTAYNELITGADANPNYAVPCGGLVGVIVAIPDTTVSGHGTVPIQQIVVGVPCCCVTVSVAPVTVCQSGLPVSVTASASGGKGTLHYSWTGPNGAIPGDTATISAPQAGTYSVIVTDDGGCSPGSASGLVTVNPLPTCNLSPPNPLPVCDSTGNQLSGPDGMSVYQWTLLPGAGPNWAITGGADSQTVTYTAGDSSTAKFQLLVVDANGCQATCQVTFGCTPQSPPPLQLTCEGGSGQVGQPFSATITVIGGTPPYTYTLAAGSLPPGLTPTLPVTLPGNLMLSGTPTAPGSFSYTIQVTDKNGATTTSTCSSGCTPASCTTIWDFSNPSGCLGVSQTYIAGGMTITAYGYDGSGNPVNLYGKTGGGDENGLGLCGQKDNEITVNHYVVLDLADLIAKGAQNPQMWIGSVQPGELYDIAGSNNGKKWKPLLTAQNLDYTFFAIPGYPTYRYISVTANGSKNCYANVLLGAVSVDCVGACTITIAPPPPPPHNCTYTIGYYKNHPSAIAPLPVYLGTQSGAKTLVVDTQQKGVDVLSQKVYCSPSDGITKLYAQLLAAKLNIANGADGSAVASVIVAADFFLATNNCAAWSSLNPSDAALVLVWQCALDSYNNGNIGPGHCGDSTCNTGGQNGGDDGSDNGGNNGGNGGNGHTGGANCQNGNGGQGNDHSGNQGNNQNGGNGNNNCNNNGGHH